MANMDQKIHELKSYIKDQICSRDKKLEEICGNLLETFWKKIELQFTNELKKKSKRIEKLESDKIMLQNHILKIKKRNLQNQQDLKSWNNSEEDYAQCPPRELRERVE